MFGAPSSKEFMRQVVAEYGPNSPRSRMTVAAYLIEHDGGPAQVGLKQFLVDAEGIIGFIAAGLEDLYDEMAQFEDEGVEKDTDVEKADGDVEQGYTYL